MSALMPPFLPPWAWTIAYISLFGITLLYIVMKHLRYDFGRKFILNLFCKIQGRKHQWVSDAALARRVLTSSSSKGTGLEQLLSTRAFLPVKSLESVNGDQWTRMKDNFILLKSRLPPLESLAEVAKQLTIDYLETEDIGIIDCPTLSKLILEIMATWVFEEKLNVDPILIDSIEEYRKEIAVKGKGDSSLKLVAVHWIQDKIKNHRKIYEIFEELWSSDEYWSLLLQPFFISPTINVTDIAVTLTSKEFQQEFKFSCDGEIGESEMQKIILSGINYNHPFPILERWFPDGLKDDGVDEAFIIEPNTHVFIPLDQIGRKHCSSYWAAFGAGRRACGGRDIAMTLCTKMFQVLLSHPKGKEKFKPWINHRYSGRDNDLKESGAQSWFQIKTLVRILCKLIFSRVQRYD